VFDEEHVENDGDWAEGWLFTYSHTLAGHTINLNDKYIIEKSDCDEGNFFIIKLKNPSTRVDEVITQPPTSSIDGSARVRPKTIMGFCPECKEAILEDHYTILDGGLRYHTCCFNFKQTPVEKKRGK